MIDGQPVLQLPRGSLKTCPAREAGATCLTSDQTLRLLFMVPSSAREPVWEWRVGTEWPSPVVPWWAVRWRLRPTTVHSATLAVDLAFQHSHPRC